MNSQQVVLKDGALSSEIFASREGVVTVTPVEDCIEMQAATVALTPKFKPESDYVVRVVDKGGRKETQLLFGKAPRWCSFPEQWAAWVENQSVLDSAIAYIRAQVPDTADALLVAARKVGKQKRIDAWSEVARKCGLDEAKVRGKGTWTAVKGMPIRIAQSISGDRTGTEKWAPPVPRPIYQDADRSGRVLVGRPKGWAAGASAATEAAAQ
jgi:hypothetical protein